MTILFFPDSVQSNYVCIALIPVLGKTNVMQSKGPFCEELAIILHKTCNMKLKGIVILSNQRIR